VNNFKNMPKCQKWKSLPINPAVITQYFGARPWFYRKYSMKGHNGIDFRTRMWNTPLGRRHVRAVDDGEVVKVVQRRYGGYGTYVRIKHEDGGETIYGHKFSVYVKTGDKVQGGDIIGISDNTGDSSGPHLHLGYRPPNFDYQNGYKGYIDPYPYLPFK